METITFLTRLDSEFKDVEVTTANITEFGVTCSPVFRSKGGFKKWFKRGYMIAEGNYYYCRLSLISDLKTQFKGQIIKTEKHTMTEQKYLAKGQYVGERKAVNWYYRIKDVKL